MWPQVVHLYNELRKLMPERMERAYPANALDEDSSDSSSVEVSSSETQQCRPVACWSTKVMQAITAAQMPEPVAASRCCITLFRQKNVSTLLERT